MSRPAPRPRIAPLAGGLALLLLLAACQARRAAPPEEGTVPFVFRSLNLRQQDQKGRQAWELTSPEARYDLRRRVAQAMKPRGVIYAEGKARYRLAAESGTVINDGEVILLEGNVRLEQLGSQPTLIRASRVRWIPSRSLMEIDRHPEAFDPLNRIVSRRARFLLDRNQLELRGTPQLQRWSKRFDPFSNEKRGPPELVVTVSRADWQPGSGLLEATGPVRAVRRPAGSAPGRLPQTLSASALQGNTIRQEYRLRAPVRAVDPVDAMQLDAQDVSIEVDQQRIRSDQPFVARRGPSSVRGEALRVNAGEQSVEIPAGCVLEQPGERLQARRCLWNWKTQAIEAEGNLQLDRQTNPRSVRAQQLKGTLGAKGSVQVSSPGGRVISRIRVDQPRRAAKPVQPRPKPPPIRL
ncbi:MAG: LPS export ABC transporter periplasmic protein LptC [Cyanobium sp.]